MGSLVTDQFASFASGLESPFTHGIVVVPSDTNDLPAVSRALYIRGYGNLTCVMAGGETVTLPGIGAPHGFAKTFPLRVKRILATGTDPMSIVALW